MEIKSISFIVIPFHWVWPRVDKTVIHTTIFCGPFMVTWVNS